MHLPNLWLNVIIGSVTVSNNYNKIVFYTLILIRLCKKIVIYCWYYTSATHLYFVQEYLYYKITLLSKNNHYNVITLVYYSVLFPSSFAAIGELLLISHLISTMSS